MNQKEIIPLFSTPLTVCRDFLPENLFLLTKEYFTKNEKIWQDFYNKNLINNVQTVSKNALNNLPDVKKFIEDNFDYFIKDLLSIDNTHKFKMGTSWGHKAKPGSEGNNHIHSNYFWSAVLYLQDSNTEIVFSKYITGYDYSFNKINQNIFNSNGFSLKPAKNMIVYFPSYLNHKVKLHVDRVNRYSVAMNFSPVGLWGIDDSKICMELVDNKIL